MSSDGPEKAQKAQEPGEPLDDIILGDDDATEIIPGPPVAPRPSQPPLHHQVPTGARTTPDLPRPSRPPDRSSAPAPPLPSASSPPPRRESDVLATTGDHPHHQHQHHETSSSSRIKAAGVLGETGKDPKESQGRKRAKMTLRIPDDEISRPNLPATTPAGGIPALGPSVLANHAHAPSNTAPVTTPSRPPSTPDEIPMPLIRPLTGPPPGGFGSADDTLELPREDLAARVAAATALLNDSENRVPVAPVARANENARVAPVAPVASASEKTIPTPPGTAPLPLPPPPKRQPSAHSITTSSSSSSPSDPPRPPERRSAPALGVDASNEPGWTPFQPSVERVERDAIAPLQPMPPMQPMQQAQHYQPFEGRNGGGTILDPHEVDGSLAPMTTADSVPPVSEDIPVDMDPLPESDSAISITTAQSDEVPTSPRLPLDSEEIRIDEGDRISETGEVEVAPEDLVSVESLPAPGHIPPPLKTAGKYPAFKDAVGPAHIQMPHDTIVTPEPTPTPTTASALMQGVPPVASPSRPAMTAVTVPTTPSSPSSPPPAPQSPTPQTTPQAPPVIASPAAQMPPVAMSPPANLTTPQPMTAPQQLQQQHSPGPVMAARRQSNPLIFVPPVGALAPPAMTDSAAHRKKIRPWWEELFNDDFIRTMAKVTDAQIGKEVNFIEESLGCEAGAMILDLACGTGRHAVELAARGYQVVGFDLSLAMLARASDEAQDRKQKINFVQGDMREMTFEETFDGVYSWNTSFGYFDEEKNGAVIARVHKSLKKGGQFLLDVVNRDFIIRQAPSLAWFEGDGCICMDEMTIDFITSRMRVKRTLMMDDGRTKEIEYSVRVYALHELGKMLHDNGFRVAEVSGRTGTPGVFFGCESPRTLILAEKR